MGGPEMLVLVLGLLAAARGRQEPVQLAGLFEPQEDEQETGLRRAVDKINGNKTLLPKVKLAPQMVKVRSEDPFHVAKLVCAVLDSGVAAVIGPSSPSNCPVVQAMCTTLNVPHLEMRPSHRTGPQGYTVSLHPHPSVLSRAYRDMVRARGWKSLTVIFEDEEALMRLQHLLMLSNSGEVKISLWPQQPGQPYKRLLKDVGKQGETNIVLDVPATKLGDILKQAHSVGMMTEYHNYVITTLDLHTVDLQDFQHGRSNISGFRLVRIPQQTGVSSSVEWAAYDAHYSRLTRRERLVKTETALVHDAVALFAHAAHLLNHTLRTSRRSCSTLQAWGQGRFLLNLLKNMSIEGMTGLVQFDRHGLRTNFTLDVMELKRSGLSKVGVWDVSSGLKFIRNYSSFYKEVILSLKNRTLRVTTIINAPYVMLKQPAVGQDQYEGFCVDLLREVSTILGFRYELRLVRDSSYGTKNDLGEWNGMIRELVDREADLAMADLTITYEREEAVDFTMPFLNLGISILFKRPNKKMPKLFSFLAPLSANVWAYMAAAYVTVSVLLFVLARFTPYEWVSAHPCDPDVEVLQNQFTLINSLWFTTGSLMQQSSDITPRAISTRVLAASWWFFTLIIISSYTANLAAFLTAERMTSPIESADDLSKQHSIKYGCVQSGSTKSFFKNSKLPVYKRMWSTMEAGRPSVFVESNAKGVERVLKGNYAFLMESTSIEYEVQRNCELIQIGGLLDSKGYGIATPPGSPYRTAFSSAILKLQETGVLHELKERWWKSGNCPPEEEKVVSVTSELGFPKLGGVFVVLLAGLGCACILVVVEFIWKTKYKRVPKQEEVS